MINGRSLEAEMVIAKLKAGFVPYTEVQIDISRHLLEKFPLLRLPLTSEEIHCDVVI